MKKELILVSSEKIKKHVILHDKQSSEGIIIAVDYLSQVLVALRIKLKREPYRQEILDEMKRIGFEISSQTLLKYRGKMATVRNAIKNLLEEGTYSAYFDHNMNLLDDIEEYALQNYFKKWTNSKKVNKQVHFQGELIRLEDIHTTNEMYNGKAAFLNILVKVVELRNKSLNGDNVNLSAAMLSDNMRKLKDEYTDIIRKNETLEKELKSVLDENSNEI